MPGLTMIMTPEQDSVSLQSSSVMSIGEVADRLAVMQHQESTSYLCRDYIMDDNETSSCSSSPRRRRRQEEPQGRDHIIDRDCRAKMSEWCYQVSDFCKFQRETVAIGMQYLDRFLATSSPRAQLALRDKKEFQLVAMTTLYIAIKLFEPLSMDAGLLAQISHGCYLEMDVVEMEQEILKSLLWRMNGPTTHAFLNHIMALLPPSAYGYDETTVMTLLDFSTFQAEFAVSDYELSIQKPSTVALAAILNAIEGTEEHLFPAHFRFQFFQLIADASGMNPFSPQVNAARARLLKLFSENSGYEFPQTANLTPVIKPEQNLMGQKLSVPRVTSSPVSVMTRHSRQRRAITVPSVHDRIEFRICKY
eukprot:CAMPEP_0172297914 /NCGR_PEP_ID=MMETSP1058-20130122/777_1 /TAXON_ID=83371 /ORGANISM="Detonula confervacea, Strain CCMP 353" /LENGTH=362 /DNA_ID=CAMNT_0013007131 /DNA_START=28 /DNA_END=1116 /DNA_ORIENTATION=+